MFVGHVSWCRIETWALTLLCSVGNAPMPTLVVYALTTP